MPRYAVHLRGKGIDLPSGGDPIVGFFARRLVWAPTEAGAIDDVKQMLTREWHEGKFQPRNRGSAPHYAVESLTKLPWWKAPFARAPKRGFEFYSLAAETSGTEPEFSNKAA